MSNLFFQAFMNLQVFLYRLTGGKFMGQIQGLRVLLLSTVGRKTGKTSTKPLGYFNEGGAYVIIASNGGAGRNPAWFHNLRAAPRVTIEVGGQRVEARPEIVGPDKRAALWGKLVKMAPGYANYTRRTRREIPLILLWPVTA